MQSEQLDLWFERLGRAADLIGARLDDPPSLQELAACVGISAFHLHRVWRSLTGETVAESVSRLRIEASKAILESPAPVSHAAMEAGFSTPQSFARAFRRQTGMTPSQYRAARTQNPDAAPRPAAVSLVLRTPTRVVALRRDGQPYEDLNGTFGQVWAWAAAQDLLPDLGGIYGIAYDDPASVPEAELRFAACLALGNAAAPTPFSALVLPGGEHACLRHLGSYDGLDSAQQWLVGTWLPRSGREPADFPPYLQYLTDPDHTAVEDLVTNLYLPLKPASL